MIRPRGGDFLYSDQEVEVMRKDIELAKSHGADGLVLGALNEDGHVDTELCMELLGNVCLFVCLSQIKKVCFSKIIRKIFKTMQFTTKCSILGDRWYTLNFPVLLKPSVKKKPCD